jgi:hypothetical protein
VEGGSGWRVSEGNIGCDSDGEVDPPRGAVVAVPYDGVVEDDVEKVSDEEDSKWLVDDDGIDDDECDGCCCCGAGEEGGEEEE